MRLLLGLILGATLTVRTASIYVTHDAVTAANATATPQRPLVNWDVVASKWQTLTRLARDAWNRHVG